MLFYHPAVWFVSRRLVVEREMCCDDAAVQATGRRVEYATTLEWVARWRRGLVEPAWAAGIGGRGKMTLLNRIRNVLGAASTGSSASWPLIGGATLTAGAGLWLLLAGFNPLKALADDEERDGRERVERRDGDRPREGERDRPREGDRPHDGERDRPRDDVRRMGDKLVSREQLERHVHELKRKVHELAERGRREEAHHLERKIQELVHQWESSRGEGDRPHDGERDRPRDEVRRMGDKLVSREQLERHVHELKRKVHELADRGRREEAHHLVREIQELVHQWESSRREGDRPHHDLHPEVREHIEHLKRRMHAAAEAGRREEAGRLERELHAVLERHQRRDGDRRDEEREHHERERERTEGDRREGFRPYPPRGDHAPPVHPELLEVIRDLREEVTRLRAEVNDIRRRDGDRFDYRYRRDREHAEDEERPDRDEEDDDGEDDDGEDDDGEDREREDDREYGDGEED